ncbi:MAG: phage holin family protein [Nocardioides sp.]|uniref:hypothetical protein n=1 Tax=Nocardioides sp. TaxID=35761 RepID=UPI0039E229F0
MVRLLLRLAVFLLSAAVGLIVASLIVPGMTLHPSGFVLVVIIYAAIQAILSPFITKVAAKNAPAFLGGTGLVASFVALLGAKVFGSGLTINGVGSWIAATVLVWLVTAVATLLLPALIIKEKVSSDGAARS